MRDTVLLLRVGCLATLLATFIAAGGCAAVENGAPAAAGPQPAAKAADLTLTDTVEQYGITWTFAEKTRVGKFVNGDFYVVGPVKVVKITPEPKDGRNGSMLNMKAEDRCGFDDRLRGRFVPALFRAPPIDLKPGDSLVSTISVDQPNVLPRMMRPSDKCSTPVRAAAVLTCLAEQAPPDAFRPSLHDTANTLYLARNLRRELLPKLAIPEEGRKGRGGVDVLYKVRPGDWNQTDAQIWIRVFQRPWIDTLFDGYGSPVENMPQYGREISRAAGSAALVLCCDIPQADKEKLLINMVQVGIDLWGAVRDGHKGWPGHGGHGHGRKMLIVLAGYLLNDADMMSPNKKYPNVKFSEDMQTVYGKCWTGARVMYGGHVGKDGMEGKVGWGLYENLHPKDWPAQIGESYRRCCVSHCWVGEALALRLLKMEKVWDHPAFFDYVDRWMTEDDTEHLRIIKEAKDWDFSADWLLQRQSWDPFVDAMWARYRPGLGPMNWK